MNKNLKIFALGGLHEVGKNCYVIEKNEDLIIIDCGIKFLNNGYNLANGIIPNFAYLKSNKERIKGLFITHGHEDHIGGISYLLEEVGYHFPVWGPAFALALLKEKLGNKESLLKGSIFADDTVVQTAEFRVSFFRVTHSIPDSFGLIVETVHSRIVLTGDFKFDWTGIGGKMERTDLVKLAEVGKKGVDLLLSDSTNAEVPGTTPTEKKIVSRLEIIISQAPGRVIITSFASNVYRLKKIIEIAKKYDKKILLLGTSLNRYKKVIQKVSLWKIDDSIFIKSILNKNFPPKKLIIFCTGSQGEAKAVLSRLAHQIHPDWKIIRGDTIILTSSPIMDNRYNLEAINNRLAELGATIYENNKEELLHASGHACQEDLKLMLSLTKPRYFMPFHGDFRMLKVHGSLAQETGVPIANIFVCQNGEIVQAKEEENFTGQEKKTSLLQKSRFFLTDRKIDTTPNYVFDQKTIIQGDWWKECLDLRRQMSRFGVMVVAFFYDQIQQRFELPYLFTYGFLNMEKNKMLVQNWRKILYKFAVHCEKSKTDEFKSRIKEKMRELIIQDLPKSEPVIISLVEGLQK
jgi:ribonuclease J